MEVWQRAGHATASVLADQLFCEYYSACLDLSGVGLVAGGGPVRKVIVWIATLLFVAAIVPIAVGNWSHETTLGLSVAGRAIVVIAFIAAWVLTAYWYAYASSSRAGLSELVSLRARAHSAWLLRGTIASTCTAAVFAALTCFYAFGLVPHLPGERIERPGIVQRVIRTGAGSRWCTNFIVVRLDADSDAKICTEDGGPGRIRPGAAALRQGDRVTVMVRRTFLGVSADLIAATKNSRLDRAAADASSS